MDLFKKSLCTFCVSIALSTQTGCSNDSLSIPVPEDEVNLPEIGTAPIPPTENEDYTETSFSDSDVTANDMLDDDAITKQRKNKAEISTETEESPSDTTLQLSYAEEKYSIFPIAYRSNIPAEMHRYSLENIDPKQKKLQFAHGIKWIIEESDEANLSNWSAGDIVALSPNRLWFSKADYVLTNETLNESVKVNFGKNALPRSRSGVTILTMDLGTKEVYLTNNSIWVADDSAEISTWQNGDLIVNGEDMPGWFSNKAHILFNCRTKSYVKVFPRNH